MLAKSTTVLVVHKQTNFKVINEMRILKLLQVKVWLTYMMKSIKRYLPLE